MLRIGETIPDLEAEAFRNEKTNTLKLNDYRGKWLVLLFYPADFTFVCPTELTEAARAYPEFQEEGAEILSVSTDTVFVHAAWHKESPSIKAIQYPMVADPSGARCRAFGTYLEGERVSLRATFIIDPDGKLVSMELHDNSIGRSTSEILRKLRAARYVREHKGGVCPASWKPGEKTIKPGLDLVGKL